MVTTIGNIYKREMYYITVVALIKKNQQSLIDHFLLVKKLKTKYIYVLL